MIIRTSVSESEVIDASESESELQAFLREVAIIKPRVGGPAFWRQLYLIIRDDIEEFTVMALQLHSRAWLYVVPLDVLNLKGWIPSNLGIIIARNVDLTHYCHEIMGVKLKGWNECKLIFVRRNKKEVKRWWGTTEVEYLEIIDGEKRYEVYRGPKPRESGADSESEVLNRY